MKKKNLTNCCDFKCSAENIERMKKKLPLIQKKLLLATADITEAIIRNDLIKHIGCERIPSKESIIEIIEDIEKILFPGYFGEQDIHESSLEHYIGYNICKLFDKLSAESLSDVQRLLQ